MANLKLSSFVLFVADVGTSKDFYVDVLGQEVAMDINNINVGFKSGLALWDAKYATTTIFGDQAAAARGGRAVEIYFETGDIDAAFESATAKGVRLIHPIKVQPWQQRVFRFHDPDDFIIEMAETMDEVVGRLSKEGLSAEEVSQKTFMPLEVVQALARKG